MFILKKIIQYNKQEKRSTKNNVKKSVKAAKLEKNRFADSRLYILSRNFRSLRRCPVPDCNGQGNINEKFKTHYSKKNFPNNKNYLENNNDNINSVLTLSEEIKTFDFNKFVQEFKNKEINYEEALLSKTTSIKKLVNENNELKNLT